MADTRTLKLSILADVDNLRKGLKKSESELKSFGDFTSSIGRKIELAFKLAAAAAGAYAIKIAVDGVRAAIEDEAAQIRLANALRNTTQATQKQIVQVEDYITRAALATGVSDDQLRPAFQSLAAVTNDVTNAQKMLNLALQISAGTGVPLATIVSALTKAYDGNFTSLDRLLPQISKADIAGKSAGEVFAMLERIFAGSIQANADSLAAKQARLAVAFDEVKETLGYALLPIMEKFTNWLLNSGIPLLTAFIGGLVGQRSLKGALTESQLQAEKWGENIRRVFASIVEYRDVLISVAATIGTIFVVSKIAAGVQATIALIRGLIIAYNALKTSAIIAGVATAFALNPALGIGAGVAAVAGLGLLQNQLNKMNADLPGATKTTGAIGNYQMSTGTVLGAPTFTPDVGTIKAPEPIKVPKVPATTVPPAPLFSSGVSPGDFRKADQASVNNYINVSTVADSESTAQAIVQVLQNSAARGGSGGAIAGVRAL